MIFGFVQICAAGERLETIKSDIENGNFDAALQSLNALPLETAQTSEAQFLLALTHINANNYQAAVDVLTRLSNLHPSNGAYIALLGRAHYELGNYQSASAAFEQALALKIPQAIRKNIENYLAAIRHKDTPRRKTRFNGDVGLALGFDTNANKATDDSVVPIPVFGNLPFTLQRNATETPSALLEYALNGNIEHQLNNTVKFFVGANIRGLEYSAEDARLFDQHSYRLAGGASYAFGAHQIIASLGSRWFTVDKDLFRRTVGGTLAWRWRVRQHTMVTSYFNAGDISFHPQSRQSSRDVTRWIGGLHVAQLFGQKQQFTIAGGVYGGTEDEQDSTTPHIGRDLIGIQLAPQWVLNLKTRVFANFNLETSSYGGVEPLFLKTRDDTYLRVRAGVTYQLARQLTVEPAIEWARNRSNVATSDFQSLAGKIGFRYYFR